MHRLRTSFAHWKQGIRPCRSTNRLRTRANAARRFGRGDSIDDQKLDIRLALMHLPIQQRNLIILRYVREHTQKETAKIMGVSQSQISRIERQALDALRKWLI
ncbi:MAG: sigma-70 family RNA polymerase sigma factor [Christensenellales bacterium]